MGRRSRIAKTADRTICMSVQAGARSGSGLLGHPRLDAVSSGLMTPLTYPTTTWTNRGPPVALAPWPSPSRPDPNEAWNRGAGAPSGVEPIRPLSALLRGVMSLHVGLTARPVREPRKALFSPDEPVLEFWQSEFLTHSIPQ